MGRIQCKKPGNATSDKPTSMKALTFFLQTHRSSSTGTRPLRIHIPNLHFAQSICSMDSRHQPSGC